MRKASVIILVGAVVALTLVARGLWAQADRFLSGAFVMEFTAKEPGVPPIQSLGVMTSSGQLIFNDSTDFGFMSPEALRLLAETCPNDAPREGELNGPGYGSWAWSRTSLVYLVLSARFDPETGEQIGMLRARGTANPFFGRLSGDAVIEFLGPEDDPLEAGETPCAIEAVFETRMIPARLNGARDHDSVR
jgi:hypothetical protein